MNYKLIIALSIGLLYLQEVRSEDFFEQARLGIGKVVDIVFGAEDASEELQKEVKDYCKKIGITHSIPVKKMSTFARLYNGYENAFVQSPGILDRMYVNEKWLQEELSPEEKNFQLARELARAKHRDSLSAQGISAFINLLQLYIASKLLKSSEAEEIKHPTFSEKALHWTKIYFLRRLLGLPFDILRAKYSRYTQKEADLEAFHTGATAQGGIELIKKMRNESLQPTDPWDRKVSKNLQWLRSYFYSLPLLQHFDNYPTFDERLAYLNELKEQKSQPEEQ